MGVSRFLGVFLDLFSNLKLLVDTAFEFADVSVGGGREMGIGRYEKAEVHMRDFNLITQIL